MNNEKYNQIIDEAYKNYEKKTSQLESFVVKSIAGNRDEVNELLKNNSTILTQEEFINKCKTDLEFSEKWGLKIEERELTTVQERKKYDNYFDDLIGEYLEHHETLDKRGVPRKITTLTYKNETVITYE